MIYLDWNKYKQKPHQWGPLSAVRSAVFRNAERLGIDPASITLLLPFWEGAGVPHPIINDYSAAPTASGGTSWDNGNFKLNSASQFSATFTKQFINDSAFTSLQDSPLSVVFNFSHIGTPTAANLPLVRVYAVNSTGRYWGLDHSTTESRYRAYMHRVLNVPGYTTFNDPQQAILTSRSANNHETYLDGVSAGASSNSSTNNFAYDYRGLFIGSSGSAEILARQLLVMESDTDDVLSMQLHATPYALLAPNPAPVFFDLAAGGTTYQATCADGISAGDTPTRRAIFSATAADGMQAGDSDSNIANLTATLADALSLSDSVANTLAMSLTVADGVAFSDSTLATILGSLQAECADGVVLSESISALANLLATSADEVSLSDSALWGGILSALAADGITLTDTAAKALYLFATSADGVTLSDAGTPVMSFSATCADGVEFAETLAAVMKFAAACSDGFEISDSASVPSGTMASGKVTITFNLKQARIVFSVSKPGIRFTLN